MSDKVAYSAGTTTLNAVSSDAISESDGRSETAQLVSEAKAGSKSAFAQLYRLHVKIVYRYLSYRLRDNSLAEDLTAEVFLRALRKIGDFEWRGIDFSAWLLRIARNILLDHVKSSGARLEVVGIAPQDTPQSTLPGSDLEVLDRLDNEALHRALNQLRPEHQEVLYLRFLQGFSSHEVAEAMGKSEGAVRVLQFRALKQLLKIMQQTRWEAG